jgi:hypothetical protein
MSKALSIFFRQTGPSLHLCMCRFYECPFRPERFQKKIILGYMQKKLKTIDIG